MIVEVGMEDIYLQVEYMLMEELGDIGKKIYVGCFCNDQVLVDLWLFFCLEIEEIIQFMGELFYILLQFFEEYKDILLFGYIYYQVVMFFSFGLWFSVYVESLVDDLWFWQGIY